MGSPIEKDLESLLKYIKPSMFIVETGTGVSTKIICKKLSKYNNKDTNFSSIDYVPTEHFDKSIHNHHKNLRLNYNFLNLYSGWSISYNDIIKKGEDLFVESRYKDVIDGEIAKGNRNLMTGEVDLIRKIVKKENRKIDFFFCDTGEYCGIAEWRVANPLIKKGGIFAIHDILHPKSIKGFQVVKMIEKSENWKVLEKRIDSPQGLLIARKNK